MTALLHLRLTTAVLFALFLSGCASTDTIRGQLNYDLRPEGARPAVFWPPAPDTPRYRYLGELVGQPNFAPIEIGSYGPGGIPGLSATICTSGLLFAKTTFEIAMQKRMEKKADGKESSFILQKVWVKEWVKRVKRKRMRACSENCVSSNKERDRLLPPKV